MVWHKHESSSMDTFSTSLTVVSDSLFTKVTNNEPTDQDLSGEIAISCFKKAGIYPNNIDYLPDDISSLHSKIKADSAKSVDLILFLGGTGVGSRDFT